MKYQELVVNGCSYMEAYTTGKGHIDLAERLGISKATSLAIGGSANTRIIRTTLKHSYQTTVPTLYVLGLTFLSRSELPILENQTEFEGRWTNPQNQQFTKYWQHGWTQHETELFIDIKLKSECFSILDRTEDLMYKILTMINDVKSRGHQILVYQQADNIYQDYLVDPRLALFKTTDNIIDGYAWRSVGWQLSNGVPSMHQSLRAIHKIPDDQRHPQPGHHQKLNEFLTNYIQQHALI